MAAELPRPGVEVIQEFRTVSPSIVTPTLVPCIVGACRQVVEVLESSALNSDAKLSLPVFFTAKEASLSGDRYVYTGLDGKKVVISVDNSPDVDVTFEGSYLTPAAIVSAFNTQLNAAGVYGLLAETKQEYDIDGTLLEKTWTFRTIAAGELEKVEIRTTTDPEAWSKLGIKPGWEFTGLDLYDGSWLTIPLASFPNPRNNLSELSMDPDSIRLFFASSATNIRELSKTTGFCRRGTIVYAYDDGDGDALTPFVYAPGENFSSTATVATLMGGVSIAGLTYPTDLEGLTLTLAGNRVSQTHTFADLTGIYPLTSAAEAVAQLNAYFEDFTFVLGTGGDAGKLIIKTVDKGQDADITISGTALQILGLLTVEGTVDLTTLSYGPAGDLEGLSVILDGTTYTFATGQPTSATDLLSELNAAFPNYTFTMAATSNYLHFVRNNAGSVVLGAGTANTALGLTAGTSTTYTAPVAYPVQSGDELIIEGKSYGYVNQVAPGGVTNRLRMTKEISMTMHAEATGTADLVLLTYTALNNKKVLIDSTTLTFGAAEFPVSLPDTNEEHLLSLLNATFTGYTFTAEAVGTEHFLKIEKTTGSGPFTVGYTGAGDSANATLGFPLAATTYDPLLGENFFITARNLTGEATRPTPELSLDGVVPTLMHDLLRDTAGVPTTTAKSYVYMAYTALRLDVSPAAAQPGLLKFNTTDEVASDLAPVTTDNPLALGLYLALLNCPGAQVTGLGVDDSTADMPEGTVEAFTRAAEFLEGVEVYAIAPLTHDNTVIEVFNVHVSTMSEPENKGERIAIVNSAVPTHKLDTLVASGTKGNSLGSAIFDTSIPNLSTLLLAAGIPNPVGTIDAKYGVYIDLASDAKKYSVESVSGSIVTIRLVFTGGENDDGFYAQTPDQFPPDGVPLIDETFSVKIRGEALTLPTGKPDKSGIALTLQEYAQTFLNRRLWHIFPDKCAATVDGIEQELEGYYMCAGYAGLVAGQPPQQSFTNFPLTGFTRVIGSNDTYSEKQLNIMAAGGNWIVVQEVETSPLVARFALTTDMTSVETRTDSITKVVDFTAKIMRRGYRNFIGRFNVTQGFLDSLGQVGQGILTFLTESGVLIGGNLNNIVQDEASPDTVLIDCTLDPPYPCNYIRLTLVI